MKNDGWNDGELLVQEKKKDPFSPTQKLDNYPIGAQHTHLGDDAVGELEDIEPFGGLDLGVGRGRGRGRGGGRSSYTGGTSSSPFSSSLS